jgi:uncharacterized protein (UPF0548 family)
MAVTALPAQTARRLRAAGLTYPEAGATATALPAGYHHVRMQRRIGTGPELFVAAGAAVLAWAAHTGAGLTVAATAPVAAPGTDVLLTAGAGPVRLHAPCRVIYVIDEPRRRGFAYGTLAGHPESGEEAFVVELAADDAVTFVITAFSRPATALSRLAGPLGRQAQRAVTRRYLRALARAVAESRP